jgi:hypothetical protein
LNFLAHIISLEARLLFPLFGFRRGGSNFRSIIEWFLFNESHSIYFSVRHKWIGRLFDYLENVSKAIFLLSIGKAQRLAAQPLGRFRFLVTILTGKRKSQFSVLSLSLGQVGCSRGLGPATKWDKRM